MNDDNFEYKVNCDGCGRQLKNPTDKKNGSFFGHFDDVQACIAKAAGWTVNFGHCYCPKCTKAKEEYGVGGRESLVFTAYNLINEGDDEEVAIGQKLLKDGYDYVKSHGYDAVMDDESLGVKVYAAPDLIKFYADRGVAAMQSGPFFDLSINK